MNYEEKYKQALERARDLMTNQNPPAFDKHLIELVFPELAESEDEKIRKTLIEYIKGIKSWNYFLGISKEQMIAWLEKQGKLKEEDNKEDIVARYPCAGDPILCNPKRDGNILIYSGTKLEEKYELSDLKTEKD